MSEQPAGVVFDPETKVEASHYSIEHHEEALSSNKESQIFEEEIEPSVGHRLEKRIKRKLDLRLLPILSAIYTMALVDRTNLGGARIAGMDEATGLDVGNRASVTILVFYIGYIVFEIPSNMVLKKVGPAIWISALAAAWGLVTLGIGFSKNYQTVAVCRVLLGIFEAGMFPGCLYLMASWYQKFELQKRVAIFFMTGSFLSSFANILCLGLTRIANNPEKDGWKYIFIVQGAMTIAIAAIGWFAIVDFPDSEIRKVKFLSADEAEMIKLRLIRERGSSEGERVSWDTIRAVSLDWRVWSLSFVYMAGAAGVYGLLLFLPIVLRRGLGYSQTASYLLAAPPAAAAVIFTFVVSVLSDKYHVRGPFVLLEGSLAIIGLCMIGFLDSPTPRYIGSFFGSCGSNALIVTAASWQQNNIRGDAKRSVLAAFQVMSAGVGGIYSALVFRQQDSPNFVPGLVACCALVAWSMVLTVVTIPFLVHANRQADRGKRVIEGSRVFRYVW
ncbi:uncharacterized protein A1O5_11729 [Cladophialophora psammophila CBS 110553]|uniref:Major facilitator superfamily (MFS) profile domain-containing protein n=1 Tax=Cladophialophora psammophila CBS 110553 TaxID=1182543 RepID=W9WSX2_9EURO|nr:uncharacterized protein A1O5_11729 [Cladophialophora psammophila CBS 110553]EXJ61414.1 hypothetical protein A1O5_11729 [Cladophialophora psammophila CBS 110553]